MPSSKAYRHVVTVKGKRIQDEYGELIHHQILFRARADVLVRSGSQLEKFGTSLTSEIITIDMFNDTRLTNDCVIDWKDKQYEIQHIKPDRTGRKVIVTAEVVD